MVPLSKSRILFINDHIYYEAITMHLLVWKYCAKGQWGNSEKQTKPHHTNHYLTHFAFITAEAPYCIKAGMTL